MIRFLNWLGKKLHRHQWRRETHIQFDREYSAEEIRAGDWKATHSFDYEWCPRCSKVRKI